MFLGRGGPSRGGQAPPQPGSSSVAAVAVGRLAPSSKARLNPVNYASVQQHSTEMGEGQQGRRTGQPPQGSPPELLLFNQSSSSGSSRAGHYNRSLPEVPNIEEIMEFMRENWNERIAYVSDPRNKLNVLWLTEDQPTAGGGD